MKRTSKLWARLFMGYGIMPSPALVLRWPHLQMYYDLEVASFLIVELQQNFQLGSVGSQRQSLAIVIKVVIAAMREIPHSGYR